MGILIKRVKVYKWSNLYKRYTTNRPQCFHSVKGGSHEKYSFYDITQISINRSISMYDNEMRSEV